MKIEVQPSSNAWISIPRQQEIIDTINKKLAANPRQGFCFIGSPGTGKTYMMKAIRDAAEREYRIQTENKEPLISYPSLPRVVTLAEWQEANRDRSLGKEVSWDFDQCTPKYIRRLAEQNRLLNPSSRLLPRLFPFKTLHISIDEFDSQPTVSEFSSSNLQSLVNACYENAPRLCEGNDQDFVQFVVAMNKDWSEFEEAYGVHVSRRIAEMCVRIDFDKMAVTEPEAQTPAPDISTMDEIDRLCVGEVPEELTVPRVSP